jgi:hypothetical protein
MKKIKSIKIFEGKVIKIEGMNLTKVHYMYVWKYYNETTYSQYFYYALIKKRNKIDHKRGTKKET